MKDSVELPGTLDKEYWSAAGDGKGLVYIHGSSNGVMKLVLWLQLCVMAAVTVGYKWKIWYENFEWKIWNERQKGPDFRNVAGAVAENSYLELELWRSIIVVLSIYSSRWKISFTVNKTTINSELNVIQVFVFVV